MLLKAENLKSPDLGSLPLQSSLSASVKQVIVTCLYFPL